MFSVVQARSDDQETMRGDGKAQGMIALECKAPEVEDIALCQDYPFEEYQRGARQTCHKVRKIRNN